MVIQKSRNGRRRFLTTISSNGNLVLLFMKIKT